MVTFKLVTVRAVRFRNIKIKMIREKTGIVVKIIALQLFHKIKLEA